MLKSDVDNSEQAYKQEFIPDTKRSARLMVKSVLRHPIIFWRTFRKHDNLENHLDEYAHRVSFGRTEVCLQQNKRIQIKIS